MQSILKSMAILFLILLTVCGQSKNPTESREQKPGVEVTYIGNEGLLIGAGAQQIIIDGIHGPFLNYTVLAPPQIDDLTGGRKPFDRISLILVSHFHADHFNAKMIGAYLQNNPQAKLVCPQQALNALMQSFDGYHQIEQRAQAAMPNFKERVELTFPGVKVTVLRLLHSGPLKATENLGYLLEFGGRKLLHVGDADLSAENYEPYQLNNEAIDVAFIPYWYLADNKGAAFVRRYIPAKQIVAIHIPPAEVERVEKQMHATCPEAIALTRLMERRTF